VLLDIHQVKLPSQTPFWIFPYSRQGFQLARELEGTLPIITHWAGGFSKDGQCTDEFVNNAGGVGITIELGQNGFDPLQIALGSTIARRLINSRLKSSKAPSTVSSAFAGPLYTWSEVLPYPDTGVPVLDPGWTNFAPVAKGQRLGAWQGHVYAASSDGVVMFPKYPKRLENGDYPSERPAAELVRILRRIEEGQLPK
jgi:hypothetical protein